MIGLHTHSNSPFTKEFWKWVVRTTTRKYSGPQAVRDSLTRGLEALNIPFSLDRLYGHEETAVVLSGTAALQAAIRKKRAGDIQKLIAGPNIVITPHEANKILFDPAIDQILVPCQWVKDYYHSIAPELSDKVSIWPAGVSCAHASSRDGSVIIYAKDDMSLREEAETVVRDLGYNVSVFTYGTFTHKDYLHDLKTARAVIYIARSESQGLALQEAWMHDVPTFVHFTGYVETPVFRWEDEKINAPYLTHEFGAFYHRAHELVDLFRKVNSYHPRNTCKNTLSDSASTKKLLEIINYDNR